MCLYVFLIHEQHLIVNWMLKNKTEMKTVIKPSWNINETQQHKKSQTEFVNGVHPLHWATSPGPSPMGTDPFIIFEWYNNGFYINFNIENRMLETNISLQDYSPRKLHLVFKNIRKLTATRNSRLHSNLGNVAAAKLSTFWLENLCHNSNLKCI